MSGLRSIGIDAKTRSNAATVREVVIGNQAKALALGMRDLYKECVNIILKDDNVRFHVMMMPSMTGQHYTYCMADEVEMCQHVADLENIDINENDCVVILGHDFLTNEISEDEMMETVISDIAFHLSRIYPVTERETGWYGKYIGWSAIASVVVSSHPMIRAFGDCSEFNDRIKNAGNSSIVSDQRSKASDCFENQNRCAFEAIERICDLSLEEFGGYITLPTTAKEIANVAVGYYHEAVNNMSMAPRVIS
jgi:hypothetical protein